MRQRRSQVLAIVAALALLTSNLAAEGPSEKETFSVRRGVRQLFLDDVGVAEVHGLERVVHPPRRHPKNPLLVPDTAWEERCQVYGTAHYDEQAGLFKLWYLTTPKQRGLKPLDVNGHLRPPHTTMAAYATSKDGIRWTKPILNTFPYDGDTRNNLLGIGLNNCEGISVLHEPGDPDPKRRWKAIYWDHGSGGFEILEGNRPYSKRGPKDGIYVAFSPDGVHWTPYEGNPVIAKYCDTNQNVLYDPRIKKYVAFSRFGFGRRLARSESEDFLHWSEPQLVLECDEADGPGTQIYGAGVDLYEGVYLAMVWIYREGGDKKIDTQLATSRDGVHWTRVGERATWLKLGDDDIWEGGMVRSVERIIRRGETLYIYYCGVHGPHIDFVRKYPTSIGLLMQRRDGFVSLHAGAEEGTVHTQPFALPAGSLHVNADLRRGNLGVALCDADGRPIPGFERSCNLTGDLPRGEVVWDQPIPDARRGEPVRLRFALQRGELLSYWWE